MNSQEIIAVVLLSIVIAGAVSGFVLWWAGVLIERDHADDRGGHDV